MTLLFPAAHKASYLAVGTMISVRTGFGTAWVPGAQLRRAAGGVSVTGEGTSKLPRLLSQALWG